MSKIFFLIYFSYIDHIELSKNLRHNSTNNTNDALYSTDFMRYSDTRLEKKKNSTVENEDKMTSKIF